MKKNSLTSCIFVNAVSKLEMQTFSILFVLLLFWWCVVFSFVFCLFERKGGVSCFFFSPYTFLSTSKNTELPTECQLEEEKYE